MLIIGGTRSGCGKSTITLALLSALKKKGLIVQPFKCGPDFIDTGLHSLISGRTSRNLDLWMCGKEFLFNSIERNSKGADSIIIEGVMGLFDGGERSTAKLAETLDANVLLVVDAYGMAESAAPLVHGFNEYLKARYGSALAGVVFNRVSGEKHYERLKDAVREITEPLGYLSREAEFTIPERHLGLTVAEEKPISDRNIDLLARSAIEHMDMEKIISLARNPYPVSGQVNKIAPSIKIAVARDKAFSFYYEDNFDILRQNGAELVFFSPLEDPSLPEGVNALYFGGGYPELYARELSGNKGLLQEIRDWAHSGRPIYAECGGFIYLSEGMNFDEQFFPLCGIFPWSASMRKEKKPVLGYREAVLQTDCQLGKKGRKLRGHEFHYSELDIGPKVKDFRTNVFGENENGRIISANYRNVLASYIHFHFGSSPEAGADFVNFVREPMRDKAWKS